jgi:ribosomal protein S18 acetylase RimI-like enzyme
MEIKMIKAENRYQEDCVQALYRSELGRVYFPEEDKARRAIEEGFSKGEFYLAINNDTKECLGFLWYIPNGAFHSFPYLHIIAVKEQYRGLGIGKQLLSFFETTISQIAGKAFLVVADFNPRAKQLYQSIGYKEIGIIPNLYKSGVNECLMMKEIK